MKQPHYHLDKGHWERCSCDDPTDHQIVSLGTVPTQDKRLPWSKRR